jgi:glyoxylase-like metal-dependent hydrolase (beta-lactamase superfamily II)
VTGAAASLAYPHAEGPAEGMTAEVAPGLHWVRMRVPFPPEHINLWLLEDGAGWTIVDCGLGLEATHAAWDQIFATRLGGRPVTRIVVTHFHPDHVGSATWLAARWGAEVWMTEGEWMTARGVHAPASDADIAAKLDFYRRNGVPADGLEAYRTPPNAFYRKMVPEIPARFVRLRGGQDLAIGARNWRIVIGRGHAPEHACRWCAELGVLIAGDILLPRISPNVSVWATEPFGDPLADFLGSLDGFAPVADETLVLPAHGLPYLGIHARIAALRGHHESHLATIAAALRAEPRHAVGCFPLLFRREIGAANMGLALGEAVAHLHRLEAQGRARRETGADGIHRFRAR